MTPKRNPHDRLFRAADSASRAFERRKAAELRQNARTAQQQKNWALAETLWRKSLDEDKGDRSATIGLANVLVYNGKFDEARRLAESLVANWPQDESGPTVLARLAEEDGDTAEAIAQWRRVLVLAPGRSQALIRLGRLMLADGEFAQAAECAAQLALYAPDNPAAGSLLAEIAQAQGDLPGAVRRRRELTEKFPQQIQLWREYGAALLAARDFETCEALVARLKAGDPQNGLRLEGQLLAERRPESGHSAFWKDAHQAFPQNADFLRKYLHAALRDGLGEEARAALDLLLGSLLLRASDANFVIGMVNMLESAGDARAIRRLVRDFLKRFRASADYRRIALRLSRIVFQHFPKAKAPFASAPRTLAMLRHTPADPGAARFVEQAIAVQASLRNTSATRLFDTDISREECARFVADIRARLASATPTSFIRVGDGESNALAYAPELARHAQSDAAEREVVWWGRALDAPARQDLSSRVLEAMTQADGLGVPALERILRDVRLERRDYLPPTRVGRGIRTVLAALDEGGALHAPRPLVTSAHIQHDLQKWNLYRALFAGQGGIVAVSCHPGLPAAFETMFATAIAKHIVVPPRHASLAAFGLNEMGPRILPEALDDAVAELDADLAGRLVIVGAGYAGKVIVHEAKARGAVALDLGSILDYWLGIATRSYLTASAV